MEFISNCTADAISKAVKALKNGHLVAFPTETVYGLGADATNENAVSQIYAVKGRPMDHPLIVHISSINQISKWATDIPDYAIKLASDFWPGPMTLILKRSNLAKDFITGGQANVGLRVPNHPLALALLAKFESLGGQGVAAPSANRFGAVSPTSAESVDQELGEFLTNKDLILDGGDSDIGVESTIIDCTSSAPQILRPGAVTLEMIQTITDMNLSFDLNHNTIKAPGTLINHYSPKAKVWLDTIAKPGEGFIAMSEHSTPEGAIRLANPKNIEEYAHILYKSLRESDELSIQNIVAITPKGSGLADAIRDRLLRAATTKEL
jgi:L-threonylcarbamoyladenylate synthase